MPHNVGTGQLLPGLGQGFYTRSLTGLQTHTYDKARD
jgi:hypothetical protein